MSVFWERRPAGLLNEDEATNEEASMRWNGWGTPNEMNELPGNTSASWGPGDKTYVGPERHPEDIQRPDRPQHIFITVNPNETPPAEAASSSSWLMLLLFGGGVWLATKK